MTGNIRLINSGFSLIDKKWGGIYRGGSYLIVGPRKSGRTLLGLQFAQQSAISKESCLYFTTMRPKDLMIQASSIGFDLQGYMNKNNIIVVRVSPPHEAYESSNTDQILSEYIADIVSVVKQYNPSRVIFDELTYYVGFNNINYLREIFLSTLETIEEKDVTSIFIMGEPATPKTQQIVDSVSEFVTGVIYLKKSNSRIDDTYQGGTVVISPNVGHPEGRFTDEYIIKPYKGLLTLDEEREIKKTQELKDLVKKTFTEDPKTFIERHREDVPVATDPLGFTNLYEFNDFSLVLNNQIALYRSTGQNFNLISFKLDPAAQVKGLLSVNQLQNAIRLSVDKKDKICVIENRVVVLLINSTKKNIQMLFDRIENSMPSRDEGYINAIKNYISVLNLGINDSYDNANTMLSLISESGSTNNEFYQSLMNYVA